MNNPEVFLSYAWEGESEKIANELDTAFQQKGISLIRDKRNLEFRGSISEFMQRLGKGKAIVAIISKDYLESPYSMFELLEIYRNRDSRKRIFPIVLEDTGIFEPLKRLEYHSFWEKKLNELDNALRQHGWGAIKVIGNDYDIYEKIFRHHGEVTNVLKDINALTPGMHRANNFMTVIQAVEDLIRQDLGEEDRGIVPVDLEFIANTLKQQKCILFLGPELFRTKDNTTSKQQLFFEELARKNSGKILSYNQNGFFIFSNEHARRRISMQIIHFYEQLADDDLIRKIAEIPFHTVVSINPDMLLKKFFDAHQQSYTFEYFDRKRIKDLHGTPSIQKPLLYNLCGSVIDADTMVLTHDDLFEYFKSLLGNNMLPQELRTQFESAEDYIFLGFQFDKWYVQLILSLLNLHDEKYKFIRYASANAVNEETESLCINHFKLEFIGPDNLFFISKLHEKCREEGMLRRFKSPVKRSTDEISTTKIIQPTPVDNLKQKMDEQYRLLADFEAKLLIEKDPIKIMNYETEIENIKEQIMHLEKDLATAGPAQP